jgi:hypothetical protein
VRIHCPAEARPAAAGAPVVVAPRRALRQQDGSTFVWVASGGRLRRQEVRTGTEMGERVAIAQGLLGGEALVVGDVEGLREGRRVEVKAGG